MDITWEKNSSIHAQIVFRKAERTINLNTGISLREAGLTTSQFGVLDILYTKGEMRICHLIHSVLATSGNMTVIIKNMEKAGLIYREVDRNDRRASVVGLTEQGRKLFEEVLPKHRREIEEVYSVLTAEEKEQLISILRKFKNIDDTEEDPCQKK